MFGRKGGQAKEAQRDRRSLAHISSRSLILIGLLVDVSGVGSRAPVGGCIGLLVREVPTIEVAGASAQVSGKSQPSEIRGKTPRSDWIDL